MMEVFNQPSGKKKHLQETLSGWQMELEKKGWQHSTILSTEESVYIDATYPFGKKRPYMRSEEHL